MINPSKIADDLKKSGGFIPGVRPGEETASHIDSVVSRITFPGSLFLAIIAVVPAIAKLSGVNDGCNVLRRNITIDYGRCGLRYTSTN